MRWRKLFGLALLLGTAIAAGGCRKAETGLVDVTIIGERPKLVDPATGQIAVGDALLLANVAQGLVRFDARGQIEAGLAERWNVSNDGLSYIFRLQSDDWPSGRKIDAREVARLLNRARRARRTDPLRDTVGAIEEIVAMTDRVIEIRLGAPRPNLLQLLAQPEFAVARRDSEGLEGGGPFVLVATPPEEPLHLRRTMPGADGDSDVREEVRLTGLPVPSAVARFEAGETEAVLGGTFADLAVARMSPTVAKALRFDPVAGLFALVPGRRDGPLADRAFRSLLNRSIDRDALIAAIEVEGLSPRVTLLQPGLDGLGSIAVPGWSLLPLAQRRPALIAEANRLFGRKVRPVLAISLPAGPGSTLLFNRLAVDWGAIGIRIVPAPAGQPVDLKLIDEVAPSTSPAWFVRRFRCDRATLCHVDVDALTEAARATMSSPQRAQFLATAAARIDNESLVFPIAAPIRWSLVSSDAPGFAENRFARHTLARLGRKSPRGRRD